MIKQSKSVLSTDFVNSMNDNAKDEDKTNRTDKLTHGHFLSRTASRPTSQCPCVKHRPPIS